MCISENINIENDHETMRLHTIKVFSKPKYGDIITVEDNKVVTKTTMIHKFLGAHTRNGGGDVYLIWKSMLKKDKVVTVNEST